MLDIAEIHMNLNLEEYHVLDALGDHISILDKDLTILWANQTARRIFGDNLVGHKCYQVFHGRSKPCEPSACLTLKSFQDGNGHEHETQMIDKEGQRIYFHCKVNVLERDAEGQPTAVIEVSRDITQQRLAERTLQKLEQRLQERVVEVTRKLDIKNKKFEETNITLRVLTENLKKEKEALQENFLNNLKRNVDPYFASLKRTPLNQRQKDLMELIESNMQEITSTFSFRSSFLSAGLTAQEQRIADLIRLGRTSKGISNLLTISSHTVDTHRRNIRKKLGFNGGRENLRSHLMALN